MIKAEPDFGAKYIEINHPKPNAKEIVVRPEAAAICGTDIHLYEWDEAAVNFTKNFQINFPLVLGHEFSGEVVELGSEVKNIKAGDRVALETHIPCGKCYQCSIGNRHNCQNMGLYGITYNGCFADYAIAPAEVAFVLPEGVSYEEGALFEPAGVAMRAIEEAAIQPGDTVLIYGCGPIGQLAIQMANVCGAAKVIAIDINPFRINMARALQATTINAKEKDAVAVVKEFTRDKGGVDVAIELTGSSSVYKNIFEMIRLEGRLVTVGHPSKEVAINITKDVNQKGLALKGVFGRRIWSTWQHLAGLVEEKKIDLLKVVTHRFKLDQYEEAFKKANEDACKILFVQNININE